MGKNIAKFRVGQIVWVKHHNLFDRSKGRIIQCAYDPSGGFTYTIDGKNWRTSAEEKRLKLYKADDTWRTVVQCDFAETTPSTPKGGGSKILKLSCGHTVRRKRSVPTPKKVDCPQCRLKRR